MTASALSLTDVRKDFGATSILKGVNVDIVRGEHHAIIGPNGAGKSTLFHVISGLFRPTSGTIRLHGKSIGGLAPHTINRRGLARNFQVTNLFGNLSVFDNLRCGVLGCSLWQTAFWRSLGGAKEISDRAETLLEEIGLTSRRDVPASVLSYAEQRALEIGLAVAGMANVILLDEPTAGMSNHETDIAIQLIERITKGKTLVMVEHDMSVVFKLADRISVLVYGEIIATGTPDDIRNNQQVQEAYLGRVEDEAQAGAAG
jgi:branched-chain amino acid transport system ATP-binding protein